MLVIVLGSMRQRVGFSPKIGKALITVGVIGLLSTTLYLIAIFSAGDSVIGIIGLIECGAAYPFLIGLRCAGALIWNRRTLDPLDKRPGRGRLTRESAMAGYVHDAQDGQS